MRVLSNLNTYYRLLVLIFGTSILFFLLYASLFFYTQKQENTIYKSALSEYQNSINSIFKLNSKPHLAAITDVTFWDELVDYTQSKDAKWYNDYIESEFPNYEVNYLAIYGLDKSKLSESATVDFKTRNFFPPDFFDHVKKKKLDHFFMKTDEGVVEVFGATIHPSDDPKKNKYPPSGYFVMVRLLNDTFLKNLEEISSSKINITAEEPIQETDENLLQITIPLKNWKNEVISDLNFKRDINLNFDNTKKILLIIVFATLLNLLIYFYYFRKWVFHPITLITKILETKDKQSILKLKSSRGEFGHIGNLFEENDRQREQLIISKEKAEESDRLKSSFLANLSHEIRTPMNAIIGFSDLIREGNLGEKEKSDYLQIIAKSGQNLTGIIEDLIEMSKIDSSQITPKYTAVNIEQCILGLYNSFKLNIPEHVEIELEVTFPTQKLSTKILTDEVKLSQILSNLITNSIKFTSRGTINIGYQLLIPQEKLEIWVEDTGLGIDPENHKIIFERFRRIENDKTVSISGLGLGLSITKAYVELLGGAIQVSSSLGVGSKFSFTIPLKYDDSNTLTDHPDAIQKIVSLGRETILVAEDDDINYMLLEKILKLKNYSVIRAHDGQEAVQICLENPHIDLIFMDIKMPIMNGFEAFKEIRKFNAYIPIIANTAYSSSEDKQQIKNIGFNGHITKPIQKNQVYELLEDFFGPM